MIISNNTIWNNTRKKPKLAINRNKINREEEPMDTDTSSIKSFNNIITKENKFKYKSYYNKDIKNVIFNNIKKIKKEGTSNKLSLKSNCRKKPEDSLNYKEAFKPKKTINADKGKRTTSFNFSEKIREVKLKPSNNDLSMDEFLPKKTIHKRSQPGIIGLINIGATCYMNATLQCFSNLSRFRSQLLAKELYQNLEKNKFKTKKLSFALAEVLKNLWEKSKQKFYAPENFKKVKSEMNSLFKGIEANDPKDLILFLLETMHNELNNPPNKIIKDKIPNNTNLNEVYNSFVNYYSNKNKSIISDEFYGFINTYTNCGLCNVNTHKVQIINTLFFPLEEVKKYKNYRHNNVSILDCFEYYEKIDYYPSFHCNKCNKDCYSYSQTKIVYSPLTLIINLNREGSEFKVNIIFEEYLNLRKYIYSKNSPYYYELTGVICHFTSNDKGGHFISYCKNSDNCKWYKYNDQFVSECNFNEVKNTGVHYTLFYNYIKT